MNKMHDIFGPGSNIAERIVRDYEEIKGRVEAARRVSNFRIVLTSGTFDLFHEGHSRYLEKARQRGDILIVGVDSDAKVKKLKGTNRPVVSEGERMEILCHCRHVDLVFLKDVDDPRWNLIKAVRPDVLIVVQGTYNDERLEALKEFCGEVVVLEPQAITSTTARIRLMLVNPLQNVRERLSDMMQYLEELGGGT